VFLKIGKGEKRVELRCLEGGTSVLRKIFEGRGARFVTSHVFPLKKLQATSKYLVPFSGTLWHARRAMAMF
jgi:hypothetical protein